MGRSWRATGLLARWSDQLGVGPGAGMRGGGEGPVSEPPGVDNNNNNDDASPMSLYRSMLRPTSMLMDRMIAPINVHRITHY